MVNNFQIEIIRQFEIQKSTMESLVQDYLFDEEDNTETMQSEAAPATFSSKIRSLGDPLPDIAEGDNFVYFD